MSEQTTFVFGPPGTGKTTWAVNHIRRCIDEYGYDPEQIVCISFTKSAAKEIRDRTNGLIPESNAATLHSLCYHALGRPAIAEKKSNHFTGGADGESGLGYNEGDTGEYAVTSIDRQKMIPINKWSEYLQNWYADYCAWKTENSLFDFTDMLEHCLKGEYRLPRNPKVIIVDEAQDTTILQRAVIECFGRDCDEIVWIGDDDQCIYDWAGADSAFLIEGSRGTDPTILGRSYRLPQEIRDFALKFIESNVQTRIQKHFDASKHYGKVSGFDGSFKDIDGVGELIRDRAPETFMILAHTNKMVDQIKAQLMDMGIPFGNPYRKQHGGWNPLGKRDGSMINALIELKKNRIVTSKLIENLKAECFTARGVKTRIEKEGKPAYQAQETYDFLPEQVRGALFSFDLPAISGMVPAKYKEKLGYIASCMGSFDDDWMEPRVTIGTFHSVKGGEADNVILMPDISMPGWHSIQDGEGDSVYRAFYVGMTRAKYNLFIGNCATNRDVMG